jgi:hypothetical protein
MKQAREDPEISTHSPLHGTVGFSARKHCHLRAGIHIERDGVEGDDLPQLVLVGTRQLGEDFVGDMSQLGSLLFETGPLD